MDFFLDGSNWDADCQEVGLVGYADPDLNKVRENVFDAIRFFLSNEGVPVVEFEERITTLEE